MRKKKEHSHIILTLVFTAIVFCIIVITMVIVGTVVFLLAEKGVLDKINLENITMHMQVTMIAIISIVIGTIVAAALSKIPLRPVNKLINVMNSLANGNYDVRLDLGKDLIGRKVSDSFNKLVDEIKSTEMLRSDFVNNFSHEFKTPIVSIRGFAKLMQKDAVSEEQRHEYLEIIVNESTRLAEMATNILNLAKVENQNILTDISTFNLSEQIRSSVLLLEKNWVEKNITINAEFAEHTITASEELLKQVWINLINNAIKFSPHDGEVEICITQTQSETRVSIKNSGDEISSDEQRRIFQKFYQGDTSHSSEGTGIGLALVKRITDLHRGSVSVSSFMGQNIFSVVLPSGGEGV